VSARFFLILAVSDELLSGADVINIIAVVVAPTLPVVIGWGYKMIRSIQSSISELEAESTRHSRTLYGDADDPMHNGLAEEFSDIKSTLGTMEREITYISRELDSDRLETNREDVSEHGCDNRRQTSTYESEND
jgi:hypothetical protein